MKIISKFLSALIVAGWGAGATAGIILDQENTGPSNGAYSVADGFTTTQTFTAGVEGILDSVEISIQRGADTTEDLFVDILSISGGTYTSLAQVSFGPGAIAESYNWLSVDFAFASIATVAGDVFGISLSSLAANTPPFYTDRYEWQTTSDINPYDGGQLFQNLTARPDSDLIFRTYVDVAAVPTPATLALFGLGLVSLGWSTRKKA